MLSGYWKWIKQDSRCSENGISRTHWKTIWSNSTAPWTAGEQLWLTDLSGSLLWGTEWLFKWKQFIPGNTQRQTCRAEVLKVSVQATRSIYVLTKMLHIVANWIWKFLGEYFLRQEAVWLPLGLSLADWGQNHGRVRQLESVWRWHLLLGLC